VKLNLGKSFDPPKVFVPPEYNNPVPQQITAPVQPSSRKKKTLTELPKEENIKKRKVEKKNEPSATNNSKQIKQQLPPPIDNSPVSQQEIEILTADLSKILNSNSNQEVALEIITIAYGNTGVDEEYELDIATLPPVAIRKLQAFVKDFKVKYPEVFDEGEKPSDDYEG